MKRLMLSALLTGSIAGLLKSLPVLIGLAFHWKSEHIYTTIIWLFLSESLFAGSICTTKGVAERSFPLIRKGLLIGISAGFLSAGFLSILVVLSIKFDLLVNYSAFSSVFVGISGGVVWVASERYRAGGYLLILSGFLAGLIGVPIDFLIKFVMTLVAFIVATLSHSDYLGFIFLKVFTPPTYGAAQSACIWILITIAHKYLLKRVMA